MKGQIEDYLKYFDKVTIVTHSRHTSNILKIASKNIAVWELANKGFKVVRRGKKEKITQPNRLIQLMTAKNLKKLAIVKKIKTENYARKTLEEKIKNMKVGSLRRFSHECLRLKYQHTSDLLWHRYFERNEIKSQDINLLSPYKVLEYTNVDSNSWIDFLGDLKKTADDPFLFKLGRENKNLFGKVPYEFTKLVKT